jgi:diguanylate cyclase (GGDEF)-like protein
LNAPSEITRELQVCGLIDPAEDVILDPILRTCLVRTLVPGEVLIRRGEGNDRLYVVLTGSLDVRFSEDESKAPINVGPGEAVGEISLLDHQPTTATVAAHCETRVLELDEATLLRLIRSSHTVACTLLMLLAQRLRFGYALMRQTESNLAHAASHDSLTGLPNRALLYDRLTQALAHAGRSGLAVAVMVLDLDRYKRINDGLGYAVGDRVLQEVGWRLQSRIAAGDTVARIGADEYVIVLAGIDKPETAGHVAHRLLQVVKDPMPFNGQSLVVTASIGIAVFPKDGNDAEQLFRNADAARYHAKEMGGNNFQFYAWRMNAAALERIEVEGRLHEALAREEMRLYYQPRVDIRSGRLVGVEALMRWQHPQMGLVSPATFVPILEESGLILEVGEWALDAACAQGRRWLDSGYEPGRIAVNLSVRQFQQPRLVERIKAILAATALDPPHLEIEITESMVAHDAEHAIRLLHDLKGLGVALAIDDFGTGYSSLAYLKRFPVDSLKIDRSFIRDLPGDNDGAAITEAVIALARSLKLKTVAEGVENDAQRRFLAARDCDEAQGYLFARPLPVAELESLLAEGRAA